LFFDHFTNEVTSVEPVAMSSMSSIASPRELSFLDLTTKYNQWVSETYSIQESTGLQMSQQQQQLEKIQSEICSHTDNYNQLLEEIGRQSNLQQNLKDTKKTSDKETFEFASDMKQSMSKWTEESIIFCTFGPNKCFFHYCYYVFVFSYGFCSYIDFCFFALM
jgi:TolA-binding protein